MTSAYIYSFAVLITYFWLITLKRSSSQDVFHQNMCMLKVTFLIKQRQITRHKCNSKQMENCLGFLLIKLTLSEWSWSSQTGFIATSRINKKSRNEQWKLISVTYTNKANKQQTQAGLEVIWMSCTAWGKYVCAAYLLAEWWWRRRRWG